MKKIESRKIVFLDRDGVINKKADDHCYITDINDFVFTPNIFPVVSKLQDEGFEFIVITNQRGIARGLYTEDDLASIHQHMICGFTKRNINILDIFYCPHENNVCECRKPKDGMLRRACDKYDINLTESILISDSPADTRMGVSFGIGRNLLVQANDPNKILVIDNGTFL